MGKRLILLIILTVLWTVVTVHYFFGPLMFPMCEEILNILHREVNIGLMSSSGSGDLSCSQ